MLYKDKANEPTPSQVQMQVFVYEHKKLHKMYSSVSPHSHNRIKTNLLNKHHAYDLL